MKNIFLAIATTAVFSACNNTPAVSESAGKVTELKNWVDSIKSIVDTTKTFDSTTWANYSAEFQNATSGINVTELDEASKTALEAVKTSWTSVGDQFAAGITKAKEAANAVTSDTTSVVPTEADVKKAEGTMIEKAVDKAAEKVKVEAKKIK
ncbi:MAG: hypothetical protein ACKOXF_04025 [Chitinophagaceae bacterium]